MKKYWENYKKPTPVKWRKIGDFSLVMIPVVITAIGGAPETAIFTPIFKYWLSSLLTILLTGFKFWTNTKKDNDTEAV